MPPANHLYIKQASNVTKYVESNIGNEATDIAHQYIFVNQRQEIKARNKISHTRKITNGASAIREQITKHLMPENMQ